MQILTSQWWRQKSPTADSAEPAETGPKKPAPVRGLLLAAGLSLALVWAFWPTMRNMMERWSSDPQYSHGFLVPVFAIIVLWSRRALFPSGGWQVDWRGGIFLIGALLLRFIAAYFFLEPLDGVALLLMIAGVCLLLGGKHALRWCWPAIAFLGFMLPLPFQVEIALAHPLRRLATDTSTFLLQTMGFSALCEGNVILIHDLRLGVIDACNGLGMLFTFFALATAVAIVIGRPLVDRLMIVGSAIPIALIVNIIRITITAMAHVWFGREIGHALMHDLAGWIMMPMALGLVWLELWLLKCLFVEVDLPAPSLVSVPGSKESAAYPQKSSRPVPYLPPLFTGKKTS